MKTPFLRSCGAVLTLLVLPQMVGAQERAVNGRVTSTETNRPVVGASVVVKGTTIGAMTTSEGLFRLIVPAGSDTLVVQRLGYAPAEVAISGLTVDVQLTPVAITLEGVVVTAMGIERERRAVGYSVQDIMGDALVEAQDVNLVNSLSGKVAGLQVTSTGNEGGSARMIVRGSNSLTGNNQPLFVVDGVPISNLAPANDGYGGYSFAMGSGGVDYGNAAMDLNMSDIESISILKGANAAALYGGRAANGAVIITTKKGARGGLGLVASSNVVFSNPLRLPNYQNQYGQGSGGEFSYVDGTGSGVNDGVDESWGPPLDDGLCIPQWHSPVVADERQCSPWVSHPDNISSFFGTGVTATNNVALTAAGDNAHARLSITRMDVDGMVPGLDLARTSVLLAGGVQVTDRLRAEGSVDYIASQGENRPGTGYDGYNPMLQFIWFGRQNDMNQLSQVYSDKFDNGRPMNWNSNYHDNPYWITLINGNEDQRDRIIGSASMTYEFNDWLSGSLSSGTDWYRDYRQRDYEKQSVDYPDGRFARNEVYLRETNTGLTLNAVRQLNDELSLTLNGGGGWRDFEMNEAYTDVALLAVPGVFTLDNAAATPDVDEFLREKRVLSLFASADFGFRDYVFLSLTGRNDWSSTLPENNRSYFYPSISGSLVFSDALEMPDAVSFGKLRAGWARVGADTDPYQLTSVYNAAFPWEGMPVYAVPDQLPNSGLKPEETESIELGVELGFLEQRLGFDVTYYNQVTRNQIIPADISATSGFLSRVVNAGAIRNKGLELLVNASPVITGDFRWDVSANWAKNTNEVEELLPGVDALVIGNGGRTDYWGVTIEARVGEPYGQMVGQSYARDAEGRVLIDDDGFPITADGRHVLGNYNPDWIGGITNTFKYKNVDLSFQLDTRQGGDIFSVTNMFGNFAGVLDTSLRGRENANCDPGVVVDGIVESSGQANSNSICPEDYFFALYFLDEPHIYDASFWKLREIKLGFDVPANLLELAGFSAARITLVGRNLWLNADIPHIDPETAFDTSNRQGFEFGQLPTPRTFGFNFEIRP